MPAGQAGAQAPKFVDLVKPFLKADANTEWDAVETLPGVKWAPLPPKELSDCLPTGDCSVRQGMGAVGGRNMVVIAQTGWGQDEDRKRSSAAGFDGHLVKPVSLEALQRALVGISAEAAAV